MLSIWFSLFSTFQISTGFSSAIEFKHKKNTKMIEKNFYLTILKFSFGIIFSISFLAPENQSLFKKKTIPKTIIEAIINFMISPTKFLLNLFLINCI